MNAPVKKSDWRNARIKGRLPPRLVRCPSSECGQYMFPGGKKCPHCGGSLVVLRRKQLAAIRKAETALATLHKILGSMSESPEGSSDSSEG